MPTPIKLVSGSRAARRIFTDGGQKASRYGLVAGTLKSTNVDAGADRTTLLRPGNTLIRNTSDGLWYDAASEGTQSAAAYVQSSEAPDADWQNATITLTIDGLDVVTVTLGAADDTIAEVVAALNAVEAFRAWAIASDSGAADLLVITLTRPGKRYHLKVTSSLATAFGASGQTARGVDADWGVLVDYCDMLDGNAVAADQHGVTIARCGAFDESELIYTGTSTLHQDFYRVMLERGAEFSS